MNKPVTAWAIKSPEGVIYTATIQLTERRCIGTLEDALTLWADYERAGYSCVKVTITEVEK